MLTIKGPRKNEKRTFVWGEREGEGVKEHIRYYLQLSIFYAQLAVWSSK